jgi:phage-related minor tail protein
MASQNIARLGVVLGLDTAEFTASIDQAISENRKLKDSIKRETNAAAKEIVALKYATEDYGKAASKVTQIEREIAAGRFTNAAPALKKQLLDQAKAYDAIAASAKSAAGAQFKMNEQQKIQLTYQTTDLVTQIASGQSPFIAILQQGGQLKDVMGGVGNALRAVGSLFTPVTIGAGAAALAIGTVALAAYQAADDLQKLQDALTLTGRFSGITEESFVRLAKTLSENTNASIGKTKDALMEVVSTGQFTGKAFEAVTQAVITYSEIAGVSAKEATDKLKGGLNGTAEGAKSLNKEMNFLTFEQYKQIEALEKAGKKQEAAQVIAVALNTKLEQQRRELGILEGAWKNVTKAVSGYYDKLKELLTGPTQTETLDSLTNQIDMVKKKLAGTKEDEDTVFTRGWRKTLSALEAAKENILEIQRLQNRSTTAKDVGDAKAKIEEYDKYKGMLRSKAFEVAKSQADAEFAGARVGVGEIENLQLESMKKLADARTEMAQKNREEDGRATAQNLEIYKNKAIVIATDTAEKIRQIRTKNMIAEFADQQRQQDEANAARVVEDNRLAAIRTENQGRTREMEFAKEQLEMRNKMIFATEKEQRLAQLSLEYTRRRKEVEAQGGPDRQFNLDQIDRQEQMAKLFIDIETAMLRTQRVFDSVWNNMGSAIDNFVKTGKLNMKDFARSVIQDLIAMEMKMQAMALLRGLFSSFMPAGPSANSSQYALNFSGTRLGQPRAVGGPVSANSPYIVGEKGPEMFIPSGSGTIIPNHSMGMASTTNVTNNYINAIDTKSFEDRLLGSSNAIWAANQYAGKNLATNFGRT